MPSAVMKPDKNATVEAEEPLKQIINVVEKKVRNLEKRKVIKVATLQYLQ